MAEKYAVGSYWVGRRESAEACARRAEHFFHLLLRLDPTWGRWFDTGRTRKQALSHPIEPVASTFQTLFAQKRYQAGEGFFMYAWNGEEHGHATVLHFTCGTSSRFARNVCVLDPPSRGPVSDRVLTAPMMTAVLRAMVLAWEPDHGVVMSQSHMDIVAPDPLTRPAVLVGWVTYLSRRRGTVPSLPEPVRVEPVEDRGSLILLTPERFTASNPEHLKLAARVREQLEGAGLLGPLLPWDQA